MAEPVRRTPPPPRPAAQTAVLEVTRLAVRAGPRPLLAVAGLTLYAGEVLALSGPSGAGKSTLLRSLNRLAELVPGLAVEAEIRLRGESIYDRGVDLDALRRRVGLVFQQPVVFPGSVWRNLTLALGPLGLSRRAWEERVESVLRRAALWPEVRDRLREPATALSVGQQQRLCLARALAVEPEVLLLDEPTSALDPEATAAVETLVRRLGRELPVLVVTHDEAQAERLADRRVRLRPHPQGSTLEPLPRGLRP